MFFLILFYYYKGQGPAKLEKIISRKIITLSKKFLLHIVPLSNAHPGKLVFPQKPSSSSSFARNKILKISEKNSENPISAQREF